MSEAPGYRSEASLRAGVVAQVGNTTGNMGMNKTWKELVEQRYIVAGSPATVRQQLEELGRSLRVGHLLLGLHIGSAPRELTQRSTYLCATEVLPHLRPLWREYEDHWWPKALSASRRAVPRPAPVGPPAEAPRSGDALRAREAQP